MANLLTYIFAKVYVHSLAAASLGGFGFQTCTLSQFLIGSLAFVGVMSYEEKNIKVLPEDTDVFGRLNWRVYCRYCEQGEAGLMENLGFPPMYFHKMYKISFPRRAAHFEYFSPVSPDNLIELKTEIEKIGTTSLTLLHTFYKKRRTDGNPMLVAKAKVTIVAYDDRLHDKTELPRKLLKTLNALGIRKK
ncbi:MAG: thioesterase family protein [Candidatus Bathyarchaeota archaeon]|nr:MAG: thioesterase family protein [Candidatus Bathyarchaeota archaeon]